MAEQTVVSTKMDSEYLLGMTMKALGSIADLRQESKVRYSIQDVVLLVVAAAMSAKATSWIEIQMFGESNFDKLHEYFADHSYPVARFGKSMWSVFHNPAKPQQPHHLGALLDSLYECDAETRALSVTKAIEEPKSKETRYSFSQCLACSTWKDPPHLVFGLRVQYCVKARSAIKKGSASFADL